MKIALVHDYLREYGGAERVLEALHELYPEAPVYVAFKDEQALGMHWSRFASWDIRETWITRLPWYKKLFSPYRIFSPYAFGALDLSEFDVVISSTNAYFAKAVKVKQGATHVCYCHTPARSLYGYSTMTNWKQRWWTKYPGMLLNHFLRIIDVRIARQVPVFVANSYETKRRIEAFYKHPRVEVIFPPVEVPAKLQTKKTENPYFLYVGRITLSKHVDLAVEACSRLGLQLKVAGDGPSREFLAQEAGPTVEFLGPVTDEQLSELYQGATALLFPAEDEDFGIVPIEAMGHGVPVIAHRSGGPRETVKEGETGLFFDELTVESLSDALVQFQTQKFKSSEIHEWALQFRKEVFQEKILKLVKAEYRKRD